MNKLKNLLFYGENLDCLKSLEKEYTNKIKCIYIDPPYNTGGKFEHYNDKKTSVDWLEFMRVRLEVLRNLLRIDGTIFVQIGEVEQAYLKVLMDGIFGRKNFINTICCKTKGSSGASGGGADKKLKKNIEFILVYKKSNSFENFTQQWQEIELCNYIKILEAKGIVFKYKSVMINEGNREYFTSTKDGKGSEIKIYKHSNYIFKTIKVLAKEENLTDKECYKKYFDKIFRDANAQSSIRTRVMEATNGESDFFSIDYIPISGRSKNTLTTLYYKGQKCYLIAWFKDVAIKYNKKIYKRLKIGTLWDDISWGSIFSEGKVNFSNGKKPEKLLHRIIDMATNKGDIVLDAFAGSGTTGAVAHKMGRRWIMIEMGDHCYTHIIPRMKSVINGEDQSGISKAINWKGGGGYKFYDKIYP